MKPTGLEKFIREKRDKNDLLLMTHLILGYPSFDDNLLQLKAMIESGVALVELQIPFSEPSADGPTIAGACQASLDGGTTVERCFEFAEEVCGRYPDTAFIFMTYLNVLYRRGYKTFISRAAAIGVKGLIIPDLPPELGTDAVGLCASHDMAFILIFTPASEKRRLATLSKYASGLVYCVGRTGVTGGKTHFSDAVEERATLYRSMTDMPLAIGFGISTHADIEFVKHKFDIAVIGTKLIHVYAEAGADGIRSFLRTVNPAHGSLKSTTGANSD